MTSPTIPVLQTPAGSTPQTLATPNADIATSQRQVTLTSQAQASTTSQTLATPTSQTQATPTLQTLASPTANTATSKTSDVDESTLPSALQPLPPFQPVSASTPSEEIDAPLSREDLTDSLLRRSPGHTPNRPPFAPSRPSQDSSSPNVESRRPTVSTRTTTSPPNSTAVAPNANRANRTPFRPARPPSQNPSLQQLQYSVNVFIEQLKACKKATGEIKSAHTATNRRMTAIENTAQRIENKLDQVLVLLCQQRTHAEPRDNVNC